MWSSQTAQAVSWSWPRAIGVGALSAVVVGLLGVSGALGVWAPIQPVLAGLSVAVLLLAVVLRWRRREYGDESCVPRSPVSRPSTDGAERADDNRRAESSHHAP
jgi:hypothetical protein